MVAVAKSIRHLYKGGDATKAAAASECSESIYIYIYVSYNTPNVVSKRVESSYQMRYVVCYCVERIVESKHQSSVHLTFLECTDRF